jgi:hypothetical protein
MEDLTIAERCARLVARTAAMEADDAFLNDHESSSDDKSDDGDFDDLAELGTPNRAGRLNRTNSATRPTKPKPKARSQSLPPSRSPSRMSLFGSDEESEAIVRRLSHQTATSLRAPRRSASPRRRNVRNSRRWGGRGSLPFGGESERAQMTLTILSLILFDSDSTSLRMVETSRRACGEKQPIGSIEKPTSIPPGMSAEMMRSNCTRKAKEASEWRGLLG